MRLHAAAKCRNGTTYGNTRVTACLFPNIRTGTLWGCVHDEKLGTFTPGGVLRTRWTMFF